MSGQRKLEFNKRVARTFSCFYLSLSLSVVENGIPLMLYFDGNMDGYTKASPAVPLYPAMVIRNNSDSSATEKMLRKNTFSKLLSITFGSD